MPRRRLISPQFFVDGELYDAEHQSGLPLRLAYAGLWCHADRRGYFEWRPRELKLGIMPHDLVDMSSTMLALCSHGFVKVFEHPDHPGRLFGVIPGFSKWQTFHVRERPDPHIPEPLTPEAVSSTVPAQFQHSASTPVTVTVTGTVLTTSAISKKRKSRSRDVREPWMDPVAEGWEAVGGPGSFDAVVNDCRRYFRGICRNYAPEVITRTVRFAREEAKRTGETKFVTLKRIAGDFALLDPKSPAEEAA